MFKIRLGKQKKQADGVVTVPGYMLWAGDVIGSAGVVAVWRYM